MIDVKWSRYLNWPAVAAAVVIVVIVIAVVIVVIGKWLKPNFQPEILQATLSGHFSDIYFGLHSNPTTENDRRHAMGKLS